MSAAKARLVPKSRAKSRRAQRIRHYGHQQRVLEHVRSQLDAQITTRRVSAPIWEGGPVKLTISPPRRGADNHLRRWGVPGVLDDLQALHLLPSGGSHIFDLPDLPDLYLAAVKASTHKGGLPYLVQLALVMCHSQHDLTTAARFARDCMRLDPARDIAPRETANAWMEVAIHVINVWQTRSHLGVHVGDELALADLVTEFRDEGARRQLKQMEDDLERRKRGEHSRRGWSERRQA